ncbi:uncharacterized protein Proc [Anabrus simplex]|uniref:uncharacterized protein Proc n=1 Tax=Anabrus simplex TaxID=316456 RepID=UPI0034DD26C9
MVSRQLLVCLIVVLMVVAVKEGQARYLPTRSQDDRIDRLRDLIRDLLESEVDKYSDNYERPVLYKREVHDMRQVPAEFPTN